MADSKQKNNKRCEIENEIRFNLRIKALEVKKKQGKDSYRKTKNLYKGKMAENEQREQEMENYFQKVEMRNIYRKAKKKKNKKQG